MRPILLMLGVVAALVSLPQQSQAYSNLAWCARYYDRGNVLSCAFDTMQQCLATVRGVGGSCIQNPRLPSPLPPYSSPYSRRGYDPWR
jgi:Protein of unknown function (DUF3551)